MTPTDIPSYRSTATTVRTVTRMTDHSNAVKCLTFTGKPGGTEVLPLFGILTTLDIPDDFGSGHMKHCVGIKS